MNLITKWNYHQNMSTLRVKTIPDRAFYIPSAPENPTAQKEDNDRVLLLNGTWNFRYYSSVKELELEEKGNDTIEVPSNWQFYGYDSIQYVNVDYPIPYIPPYVPKDNPCGVYEREFLVKEKGEYRFFLNLEGVDSCHYVFVNGQFAGYSQVSHSTSEYEITEQLNEGGNRIQIVVLKWCDGTYLEDQDKFRLSGIFRDVYILKRPKEFIFDYTVETGSRHHQAEVALKMSESGKGLYKKAVILDREGNLAAEGSTEGDTLILTWEAPRLWNAEEPYLYQLRLETENEWILDRVGIREITVEDKVIKLNGQKIKLIGVNRHESHPDTGFVCSMDRMKQDLKLMKENNVNAIRTSHYPDCPEFYRLCDEYGFYVMDEADIETHGAWSCRGKRDDDIYNITQKDPQFREPFLDRVTRLVHRDKNRPCVLFWSLGNESGYGAIACAAAQKVRQLDATRLIHYESTVVSKAEKGKFDENNLDMEGIMYPELEVIEEYFAKDYTKPLVLTEYAHAMGNGPGGLREYFEKFYQYESMAGGFVWEWCDHAVMQKTEKGEIHYLYGGDFGETLHDKNFCVDGLVYPDRTLHTGMKELWNCARPAVITREKETLYIENRMNFRNLKDVLYFKWTLKDNGELLEQGVIENLDVKPEEKVKFPVDFIHMGDSAGKRTYLKIDLYAAKDHGLLKKDTPLGFEQFLIENKNLTEKRIKEEAVPMPKWEETEEYILISGDHFQYSFGTEVGNFVSLRRNGQEYLNKPMEYQLYRAPSDNDMVIAGKWPGLDINWKQLGLPDAFPYIYDTQISSEGEKAVICCRLSMVSNHMAPIADISAVYHIDGNGGIETALTVQIREDISWLPRFGVRLHLNQAMKECTYFGYGPTESYVDKKEGCYVDRFSARVEDMFENYIKPQENGSHCGTGYVTLSDGTQELLFASDREFSFSVSEYTWEELDKKLHHFELVKSGHTILHLDYQMSGMGTGSCGPFTRPEYQLTEKKFQYRYTMSWK